MEWWSAGVFAQSAAKMDKIGMAFKLDLAEGPMIQ